MEQQRIKQRLDTIMDSATQEKDKTNRLKIIGVLLAGIITGVVFANFFTPASPKAGQDIIEAFESEESQVDAFLFYIGVARVRK